jgi:hypothetical protein
VGTARVFKNISRQISLQGTTLAGTNPHGFKKIKNLKLLKIIKFQNQLPRQTNSGTKFWNSSTNHKPQTCNNPPTFQNLHSTTQMPPVPTPTLSSSSPSPHKWTHRLMLNFPPEQDQDSSAPTSSHSLTL